MSYWRNTRRRLFDARFLQYRFALTRCAAYRAAGRGRRDPLWAALLFVDGKWLLVRPTHLRRRAPVVALVEISGGAGVVNPGLLRRADHGAGADRHAREANGHLGARDEAVSCAHSLRGS